MARCPRCSRRFPVLLRRKVSSIICPHCHAALEPQRWATMLMLFIVFSVVYVANDFLPHSVTSFVAELTAGIAAGMLILAFLPTYSVYHTRPPRLDCARDWTL